MISSIAKPVPSLTATVTLLACAVSPEPPRFCPVSAMLRPVTRNRSSSMRRTEPTPRSADAEAVTATAVAVVEDTAAVSVPTLVSSLA